MSTANPWKTPFVLFFFSEWAFVDQTCQGCTCCGLPSIQHGVFHCRWRDRLTRAKVPAANLFMRSDTLLEIASAVDPLL